MKSNKKGFTLVELLAVIVILGILSSIAIVNIIKISKDQNEKNKENVISSILTGAKKYASDNPNTLNDLSISVNTLLTNGYVNFDQKKYSDLTQPQCSVTISKCPNDESGVKLKYSLEVGGKTYDDCGCESQDKEKICTITNNAQ